MNWNNDTNEAPREEFDAGTEALINSTAAAQPEAPAEEPAPAVLTFHTPRPRLTASDLLNFIGRLDGFGGAA